MEKNGLPVEWGTVHYAAERSIVWYDFSPGVYAFVSPGMTHCYLARITNAEALAQELGLRQTAEELSINETLYERKFTQMVQRHSSDIGRLAEVVVQNYFEAPDYVTSCLEEYLSEIGQYGIRSNTDVRFIDAVDLYIKSEDFLRSSNEMLNKHGRASQVLFRATTLSGKHKTFNNTEDFLSFIREELSFAFDNEYFSELLHKYAFELMNANSYNSSMVSLSRKLSDEYGSSMNGLYELYCKYIRTIAEK